MKVQYHRKTDVLTVLVKERTSVHESDEDKPGVILDDDKDGNLTAIEKPAIGFCMLRAIRQWLRGLLMETLDVSTLVELTHPTWISLLTLYCLDSIWRQLGK